MEAAGGRAKEADIHGRLADKNRTEYLQEGSFPVILIVLRNRWLKEGIRLLKKVGNSFVTAYLLLIFGVYPFYMNQGYVDIAEAKYQFFINCSLAAIGIFMLVSILMAMQDILCRLNRRKPYFIDWDNLSLTDLFVMMYAVELFVSYSFSDFKEEALWGTEGWYMGLIPRLTLCALYFFISRLWNKSEIIWYICIAASGGVFVLGILDRFSVYLIPLEVRQSSFISTLGNINWFCGYLSVLAPVGICRFLFVESKNLGGENSFQYRWVKWTCGMYTIIVFMAGFCQGGDSIFLFFGTLFFLLLWTALKKREWFTDLVLIISLWGFSAQAVRLLRVLLPEGYNYDTDNLCARLTDSDLTLIVGVTALVVYFMLKRKQRAAWLTKKNCESIHRCMVGLLISGGLIWFALAGFNTWFGISGLKQNSFFLLSEGWGNGRGTAFKAAVEMFRQMPVFHKLIGVGPDSFSAYAYSLPETAEKLRSVFGSSRLTNAHNELLTCLVNEGILGVFLILGIFVPFVRRCMRKGEEDTAFYIYSISIVCYFCHNMVSFAQVLNIPFLFLMLGMGEAQRKKACQYQKD